MKLRTASTITASLTVAASLALLTASPSIGTAQTAGAEGLEPLGVYASPDGDAAAEIVAFDPASARVFTTNGVNDSIDVIDISDPTAPTLVNQLDITSYGAGIQSVAVGDGVVAAAVANADDTMPGTVVVFTTDGVLVEQYTVGVLPDSIAFTPDGRYIVVANEAEPVCNDADLDVDPAGSISIIDTQDDSVATADFTAFDGTEAALRAEGIRIFFPGSSASQDLEPEYVAITPDGTTAHVTLQENNAIAVVDLATATITDIVALGYKDHSVAGNGLDPSNRDDAEAIAPWNVLGMYQPDSIAVVDIAGTLYTVSANEGDARDYDCYSEEERVKDFGVAVPPYAATDGDDEQLGRLRTTSAFPTTFNGAGEIEQVYAYGARSFSIRTLDGSLVFDSGDDFEQRLAGTAFFNLDDADTDDRSDDKGPEPEALAVGVVEGRTFAFVGLERSGGVMMYDITTPSAPVFIDYLNTAEVAGDPPAATEGGDVSPEGIAFIGADNSPTGVPLLAVSFEVSGTTRLMQINVEQAPVDTTTTTTEPAATTTEPAATTTVAATTVAATTASTTRSTGTLPATGSATTTNIALIAALLLGGGTAALVGARRRCSI